MKRVVIRMRFVNKQATDVFTEFDSVFSNRLREADEFYDTVIPKNLSKDAQAVMRQSLGGLLWSKQFYHYVIDEWLNGDPSTPKPPLNG